MRSTSRAPYQAQVRTRTQPSISGRRGIHFGTGVGRRALQATVSVLDSHRSDDSGAKVGRWPTFGEVTVPKWIPPTGNMGAPA
jgi:hypothetical protein